MTLKTSGCCLFFSLIASVKGLPLAIPEVCSGCVLLLPLSLQHPAAAVMRNKLTSWAFLLKFTRTKMTKVRQKRSVFMGEQRKKQPINEWNVYKIPNDLKLYCNVHYKNKTEQS